MTRRFLTPAFKGMLMCSLAAFLVAGCETNTAAPEPAAAPGPNAAIVSNERTTVDTVLFDQCTGEDIALRGTSHVVFAISQNNGRFHLVFQSNQVLKGLGLATGRQYQSVSGSAFSLNMDRLPFEQTSAGTSRLLGQGAGGDLFVHFVQHITVDALGNLRVFNTDFRIECT
jgi:hypothetical protein